MKIDLPFLIIMALIALLASVAASLIAIAKMQMWVMFIGWTVYGLRDGGVNSVNAILTMLAGIVIGMLTLLFCQMLQPITGALALPLPIFIAVVAVFMLITVPRFANISACFRGLCTFFASHAAVTPRAFLELSATGIVGGLAGFISAQISLAVERGWRGNAASAGDGSK